MSVYRLQIKRGGYADEGASFLHQRAKSFWSASPPMLFFSMQGFLKDFYRTF